MYFKYRTVVNVAVRVPASSANLGVGYDVLALALDLHLEVSVELAADGESSLSVDGEGADSLRWDDSNRFLRGLRAGARAAGVQSVPALRVEMRNEIPLARGLGSSAAATVAGLLVGRELFDQPESADRVLELATEIEGHPENAAASLHGGFVVCAAGRVVRYEPPTELRVVLFIPERELATADMRALLPESIAHADAVHNVGRAALVVSAFATGDLSLLGAMYDDRLHEPYRAANYPELPHLVSAARRAALGAALSGAGSAVIALCGDDRSASFVVDLLSDTAAQLGLAGRCDLVRLAAKGALIT
ncbi:homoserine kinase [soil metagenome]